MDLIVWKRRKKRGAGGEKRELQSEQRERKFKEEENR